MIKVAQPDILDDQRVLCLSVLLSLILLFTLPTCFSLFFFFNDTATTEIYTLSLHDALPIYSSIALDEKEHATVPLTLTPRRARARNGVATCRRPGGEMEIGRAHV